MNDLADWLRYERTMHLAAVARIDERLAALQPLGGPLPPKTPAAIMAVLRSAAPGAMTAGAVLDALAAHGRAVSPAAVYQGLARLAKAGEHVERADAGKYRWRGQPAARAGDSDPAVSPGFPGQRASQRATPERRAECSTGGDEGSEG